MMYVLGGKKFNAEVAGIIKISNAFSFIKNNDFNRSEIKSGCGEIESYGSVSQSGIIVTSKLFFSHLISVWRRFAI